MTLEKLQNTDLIVSEILSKYNKIAMVGVSPNWKRPSNFVLKYLKKNGFIVYPVNPNYAGKTIEGDFWYSNLEDIPYPVEIVDLFRPSNECLKLSKKSIKIGAKVIWMQIGIINEEAKELALSEGLKVIMDKCPKIEHSRINGSLGFGGINSRILSSRKINSISSRDGEFLETDNLDTISIHAGTRPDPFTGARQTPIYQTTSFVFDDTEHAASLYNLQEPGNIYGRLSNPTTASLEQRLAALDDGIGACCLSSGHAAQLVALYPLMEMGKKIVASKKLYGGTITQFSITFKKFGWDVIFVDTENISEVDNAVSDPNVSVLFAESLANPDGNISDITMLSKIAKKNKIPLIIDNTMATPILCQPGKFGADIIVYSTTKFLSGHGHSLGGAVIDCGSFNWKSGRNFPTLTNPDPAYHGFSFYETFGPLAYITFCHSKALRDLGPTLSPMNAFLTLIGLETLPLRMKKHMKNAKRIANFLHNHPKINYVSWAGFKNNNYYKLAKKYFNFGFGSVFTFEVKGGLDSGKKVLENCNLISHLANIGDTRTLIIHPGSTTHRQLNKKQKLDAGITEGLLRISVGIENPNDIIADLKEALKLI